jgi:hypothetical protein
VPVDVGLSNVSNNLINGAVVAYAVALLGYAVDAAYGNHATQAAATPVAVGARVPAMAGSVSAPPVEPAHDQSGVEAPAGIGGRIGRWAVAATALGWLLQLGAVITRGLSVHRLPWGNMYEFDLALTFAAVTAFLVVMTRQRVRFLGLFVMLPVLLGLGLAVTVLYVPPAPLVPALHSYWLAIHVTAAIIASGIFTVGTAATVMYLIADSYATALASGRKARFSTLARMMPAPRTGPTHSPSRCGPSR